MQPDYQVKREGQYLQVGNDQVGWKTFKPKVTVSGSSVELTGEEKVQLAINAFKALQDSGAKVTTLQDVKLTREGLTVSGTSYTPTNSADYSEDFASINSLAESRLSALSSEGIPEPLVGRNITVKEGGMAQSVSRAFAAVGKFFKRLKTPVLLMKIYEFFEKIVAPKKFEARHRHFAQVMVGNSSAKVERLLGHTSDSSAKDHVEVSEALFMSSEDKGLQLRDKKLGAKVAYETAKANDEDSSYRNVPVLKSHGIKVKGYKVNLDKPDTMRKGRVIPTAFRYVAEKEDKTDRLANCYQSKTDDHPMMRTGVIDTEKKAKEFIEAAKQIHEKTRPGRPLRIASHQLNSMENEGKMVRNQHRHLLAQAHEQKVDLAHFNTPTNRFYDYAQNPVTGAFLSGEEQSHDMNIEGLASYMKWFVEDLEDMAGDNSAISALKQSNDLDTIVLRRDEIAKLNSEILKLESDIAAAKEAFKTLKGDEKRQKKMEIKSLEQQLEAKEGEIVNLKFNLATDVIAPGLASKYNTLKSLEGLLKEKIAHPEVQETLHLMRMVFAVQLGIEDDDLPVPSRGQELMLFHMLDKRLGVVSAVNCKSGLDRTGFAYALMMALEQAPDEVALKLTLNWDSLSEKLNVKIRELDYDLDALQEWLDEPENADLKEVFAFRNHVMDNLLNVCLPITAFSTGVVGLKWGSGMFANLIPLNFIPPAVRVINEEGESRSEQIVAYSASGKVEGLTDKGQSLMTQFSARRVA